MVADFKRQVKSKLKSCVEARSLSIATDEFTSFGTKFTGVAANVMTLGKSAIPLPLGIAEVGCDERAIMDLVGEVFDEFGLEEAVNSKVSVF